MRRAPSGDSGKASGASRSRISGSGARSSLSGFIADFACFGARMILDPGLRSGGDGATHSTDEEIARDIARSAALRASGFDLLRFTNDDVFRNLEGVLETIRMRLAELRPRVEDSPA